MYFDYTELVKHTGKDNICFDSLEHTASFANGTNNFILKGYRNIVVKHNERTSEMTLKANLPYYWQGHNYSSNKSVMIEAVNYISDLLNLDLFESQIKKFEFGCITEIEYSPNEFLANHISFKNKKFQTYLYNNKITGKKFEDTIRKIKLYDAGRNMKNKLSKAIRDNIIKNYSYDSKKHYIKTEIHYKKPECYFKTSNLSLNELLSETFMKQCKEDLINSYQSIIKTGIIKLPEEKKDINSGTLPLMILKELEAIYHFNAEELIKMKIKSIPDNKLNKYDKKSRQAQVKANLKKLESGEVSDYDILKLLESKEIN